MRVSLLGPLEITDDGGTPITLPGRKPRMLLAVLASQVDRPVSTGVIVDALWDSAPPDSVDASLRVYVHQVRRALGHDRVERVSGGYVLRRCEVDAVRFRLLAAQASSAMPDPARAGPLFAEALGLWRGAALAGLDSAALLAVEATGLEELRLQTLEHHFELELRQGRVEAVIAELRALVGRHPSRETFVGQLMRALADSGRGAEAVEVFAAARRHLIDELGVEPGPRLRELHLSLLGADFRSTVPRQLPAGVTGWSGRSAWLARLDALLAADHRDRPIAVIGGAGGIGKTTLALHWARRVSERFPDGQLYVDLHGFDPAGSPANPGTVLRDFLVALGVTPDRIPDGRAAQANLYRTLSADRRVLVVLDNARDADQVRPLLPAGRGCLVVVTSRDQLIGLVTTEGATSLPLDLLSAAEAGSLLRARLGAERLAADPRAAEQIVARCGGLPLALAIVAARLVTNAQLSLTAVAEELSRSREPLELFAGFADAATDVRTVFSWSYRTLDPQSARMFRLVGLHPGGEITVPAAAHLAGVATDVARRLLARLARGHLLIETAPGRYTFHDLVRAYATELGTQTDPSADRQAAVGRLLDHYVGMAHAAVVAQQYQVSDLFPAVKSLDHFPGPAAALDWLSSEQAALVAAVSTARESEFLVESWQLARLLQDWLVQQGYWAELHKIQSVGLDAAERAGEPAARAAAHRALAYSEALFRRHEQAEQHLRQALALSRELGDSVHEAYCWHNLAIVLLSQDRMKEAMEHEEQAIALFQRAKYLRGEALALNGLGYLLLTDGAYERAITQAELALAVNQRAENPQSAASMLDTLAGAHLKLGHYGTAQQYFTQSVELWQRAGNRHSEATGSALLGDAYAGAGERDSARGPWQRALDIIESMDGRTLGLTATSGYRRLPDVATLRAKLAGS